MGKYINLTGRKFGRLTVIERVKRDGRAYWLCKCDCGGEVIVDSNRLNSGHTKSCGCLEQENREKRKNSSDFVNKKFSHLTIIKEIPTKTNELRKVLCRCDCGTEKVFALGNVLNGHTKSCGCYRKQTTKMLKTKHGSTNTRLFAVWGNIKGRCYNIENPSYPRYGGRGIKVCDEWKNDFAVFEKWAYKNGYNENAQYGECTLDRIDFNGDYSPDNCRWTNALEQGNNKRNNRWITYNGETHTISQWARILNMNYTTLFTRFKRGWSVEEAFTIPPIIGGKRHDL